MPKVMYRRSLHVKLERRWDKGEVAGDSMVMNSCRVRPMKRVRYHWLAVRIRRTREKEKWKRKDMSKRKD